MIPGTFATRPLVVTPLVAVTTCVALVLSGCGQVTVGEQSPDTASPTSSPTTSSPVVADSQTAETGTGTGTRTGTHNDNPAPTPGPGATPGCDELAGPVHHMVYTENPDESLSAQVRELADGVEDNALSAVASRLSGLVAQRDFDPVALETQWGQFQQLCDLD